MEANYSVGLVKHVCGVCVCDQMMLNYNGAIIIAISNSTASSAGYIIIAVRHGTKCQ